jgi:hypothetical protein
MTQAEWLACDHPELLFHVQNLEHVKLSVRRRRLIGVAVCRALPPGLVEPSVLERWLTIAEQPDANLSAGGLPRWDRLMNRPGGRVEQDAREAIQYLIRDGINMAIFHVACARDPSTHARAVAVDSFLTDIVRDILGNPFRPVIADPSWLTSTVVALAAQMYESRDFSAMPILADALQDVGCENEDVLNHCRGDGPHVRGCWVVDLLTGKE